MIKTAYFKCYYAFLKKDLDETRVYYEILRDELKKTKDPSVLSREKLIELRKIRDALKTGDLPANRWVTDDTLEKLNKPHQSPFTGNQDDLARKIHFEAKDSLRGLIEAEDDFYLYNLEHPCGIYGFIDMVYADKCTHYPVELKKDEGKHDLISQIYKYDLSLKLHLHLGFYEKVQPVTICASYQNNVLKELKSIGVIPLRYLLNFEGDIRLSRL